MTVVDVLKAWQQQENRAAGSRKSGGTTGASSRALSGEGEGAGAGQGSRSFSSLSASEAAVWRGLLIRHGLGTADDKTIERLAEAIRRPGAEVALALAGLRRKGWVQAVRKGFGEHLIRIPLGCAEEGLAEGFSGFGGMTAEIAEADLQEPASEARGLQADLFAALLALSKEPAAVTARGTLAKRTLAKLEKRLRVDPLALRAVGFAYVHCDVYSESVALVLDILLREGLVRQEAGRLSPVKERVARWLGESERFRAARLYEDWRSLCLPLFPAWLQLAVLLLERQQAGEWVRVFDLTAVLKRAGAISCCASRAEGENDAELPGEELARRWLRPLASLGWLETGRTRDGEPAVRWPLSMWGPQEESEPSAASGRAHFYVQPDFEIIVPPGLPLETRWRLETLAERKVADVVSIYSLSRDSCTSALRAGWKGGDLLAFLREHAYSGLPESVERMLAHWTGGEQVGEKGLEEDSLLFPDGTGGEARSSVTGRSGEEACPGTFRLLIQPNRGQEELAVSIPVYEELFPGWREVPAAWLRECRPCHLSTRVEIARQAVSWRASLLLRSADGSRERTLHPLGVVQQEGEWIAIGYSADESSVREPLSAWSSIQLLLPPRQ
ncbi:hypothetical protein J31TS4_30740 [Paenibacillus sp. J31TS4]|uniref:helicase-associated domain-containing protein n=1 Tax=Paenibacillus sp. J31TS4 TaxID=2807195 RepID=UPI001B2DBA89|nr:helicase-associated domain-containing protein [Paenibacillus sp. J31TS4]GIP39794.1 hypothetical protein J31TS4_30740 [Paenibacillus sp. J31TS4]